MKSEITIVSLGHGDPELLNMRTIRALCEAKRLILRTGKHPIADWLDEKKIAYQTMDHLYEKADDFDQLIRLISEELLYEASLSGIVYAVSDAYTDRSVRNLLQQTSDSIHVSVIPGVTSYNVYLSESMQRFPESAVQIVPACDFDSAFHYNPNHTVLITEIDNAILAGQVKIALSELLDDEHILYLFRGAGRPASIQLYQLDRQNSYDHLTSVIIPGSDYLHRNRYVLSDLADIMDYLRSPDGCPWDREQTHLTLRSYLIEEAWECVSAIDENDFYHLGEELGDLLFQVVFHSSIGKSYDEFTLNDVISMICSKMIRRHPHVFSDINNSDIADVPSTWEKIKQTETGNKTLIQSLDDVPVSLPSLKYTSKILKKLYPVSETKRITDDTISEMIDLLRRINTVSEKHTLSGLCGRLLLLCCNLCFCLGYDSELLLHQTADRLKCLLLEAEKNLNIIGKSLESLTFTELCVYLKHVEGEIE